MQSGPSNPRAEAPGTEGGAPAGLVHSTGPLDWRRRLGYLRCMPGDAARKMTRDEIERELKLLIIDALKLDETTPDDIESDAPLASAGIGLDSIDVLELAMAIHRRFGVTSEGDDEANARIYSSVKSLTDFIEQQQARGVSLMRSGS